MFILSERKKIILSVIITFLVTVFIVNVFNVFNVSKSDLIKEIITSKYVKDVDEKKLEEYMAKGAAAAVEDDYSYYMTSEEYSALMSDITGEYKGIGVEVYLSSNGLTISNVFMNSPAEKSGLRSGDIILKVADIEVSAETYADAISFMRGLSEEGKKSETIHLTVFRNGETFETDVTRGEIVAQTIFSKDIEGVKYIRISSFSTTTVSEFASAIEGVENSKGLILDVRDNPGGILEIVTEICDMLLPEATIVSTKTRDGKPKYYESDKNCISVPTVVLINGESASASEILAGALKDNNAATLVGEKSFGKGSVQEVIPFYDESALRLTIAYYYTPSGVCINGTGIEPDYKVTMPEENLTQPLATLGLDRDVQLQKALEIISN